MTLRVGLARKLSCGCEGRDRLEELSTIQHDARSTALNYKPIPLSDINGWMRKHFIISFFLPIWLWAAPEWLLIRTVDGTQTEGQAQLCSVKIESEGKLVELRL